MAGESTSTMRPPISKLIVAKKVESLRSVTVIRVMEPPSSETRFTARFVGERAWELLVLEFHEDRPRLVLADPNRQVSIVLLDLEDNYGARSKEVHVYAVNGHPCETVGAH